MFITRQIGPGMIQQMAARCDSCNGEGELINEKDKCKKCNAKKTTTAQKIIEVAITPGMRDNQKIMFYGEGDQEPGVEPGDVVLVVRTKPHETFERRGDDLIMRKKISLNEALCGYSATITHLDGRKLVMQTMPGEVVTPQSIRGVLGEGMPNTSNSSKGNLYVLFDVDFPENHFIAEEKYKKLESLLPPRPPPPMHTDDVEEVSISDFDPRRYRHAEGASSSAGAREAYEDEDSDDEMNGGGIPGMGQRVQCNQQ